MECTSEYSEWRRKRTSNWDLENELSEWMRWRWSKTQGKTAAQKQTHFSFSMLGVIISTWLPAKNWEHPNDCWTSSTDDTRYQKMSKSQLFGRQFWLAADSLVVDRPSLLLLNQLRSIDFHQREKFLLRLDSTDHIWPKITMNNCKYEIAKFN